MSDQEDLFDDMEADAAAGMTGKKSEPEFFENDESAPTFFEEVSAPIDMSHVVWKDYPVKGKPKPHQMLALHEAAEKGPHAFILDPGAGKTFTCIAEAGRLYQCGKIDGMIVTAPNGVHIQWIEDEFPKWADFDWHGMWHRQSKTASKAFREGYQSKFGVLAINYEGLGTEKARASIEDFIKKYPRYYIAIDESQKIKNFKAAVTKNVEALAGGASYRRILSGTPILKGLEDLFSQYFILKAGITGPFATKTMAANYYGLRNYYCELAPVPGRQNSHAAQIVGYRNEQEFRDRIRPFTTRVKSDQFMAGERPDFMTVQSPMTDVQRRAYATMKTMLLSDIEGGRITAQNALVQLGKLLQIASGFIYDEEKGAQWISNNKINAIMNILEDLDEPTIIWTPFIPLRKAISEALEAAGVQSYVLTNQTQINLWKENGGVAVANQGSGAGVGQNYQHCAANIYAANTFSSEARWQSEKRTDRMGQLRQVRYWDITTPNSVDLKALRALRDKKAISVDNIDVLREMAL